MTLLAKLTILLELQYKTHAKKRQGTLSFSKISKVLHAMKYSYGSICCQEIATCSSWTNRAFYEVLKNTVINLFILRKKSIFAALN